MPSADATSHPLAPCMARRQQQMVGEVSALGLKGAPFIQTLQLHINVRTVRNRSRTTKRSIRGATTSEFRSEAPKQWSRLRSVS
ncbi:hypothetical protein CA13_01590 [Planctomycetes bacterium CA13]|uniref:Uncharacterized protein n=1 Tax=Novipirellula herctigrandis TaxID=2527986 RepID=A0A5C5YUP1_9BACT|nr:hypothetical protein CA13_01590 [Planctomycetes bacterium CA13]